MASPGTERFDAVEKLAKENLCTRIMTTEGISEIAFEASATFTTSVKTHEGTWKSKPIDSGDDFTLNGMRVGARGQFLFTFVPIDPKEYAFMELDDTKVFSIFKGFEKMIVEAMGLVSAPKTAGEHFGATAYVWADGSEHWLKHERRAINEKRAADSEKAEVKLKEAEEKAAVETDTAYAANPAYGSW